MTIHQRSELVKSAKFFPSGPPLALAAVLSSLIDGTPGLKIATTPNNTYWVEGRTSLIFCGSYNDIPIAVKLYKTSYLSLKDRSAASLPTGQDLRMEHYMYQLTAACPHSVNLLLSNVSNTAEHPFIATQLIDSFGTLSQILADHQYKLTWMWRMTAISQVASFLLFIHTSGYVHGDIGAINCLVRSLDPLTKDAIRVFDFGSSDRFGETKSAHELENLCHRPTHTPPEILSFILNKNQEKFQRHS
jgi:serine/threonine protein kinase